MAVSVVMPALEMAQESGKLIAWRKKEGESVTKGEPLLDIETDKAVLEVEAPADGILTSVSVAEGAVVPVGQTMAWIVRPGECVPESSPKGIDTSLPAATTALTPALQAETSLPPATGARISPKARRLAREHGIEITQLRGSGPEGAIVAEDVLALVESRGAGKPPGSAAPLDSVARLMAERTTHSWTTIPHFFLVRDVDASALVHARAKLAPAVERNSQLHLTHTDLLVVLVARVLRRHPQLNASWAGAGIRIHPDINIGVAVAVEHGVVVPVIVNAARLALGEIAAHRTRLQERAKAGRLHPSDLRDATFTISNLGMYDVDAFSAVIPAPQAGILAVGRIADRVVAAERQVVIRPTMTMTLSCDHRVVDGARAALFLKDLANAVTEPEKWLE